MQRDIILMRELQRNYRKLIDRVKTTKEPLYLGAHFKPEAVLVDVNVFERLQHQTKKRKSWEEIKRTLDWIKQGGEKGVNLAKFIHEDRKRH